MHTNGPWTAQKQSPIEYVILDPGNRVLGHAIYSEAECHENEANAHLISAAPDLIQACEELLAEYEQGNGAPNDRGQDPFGIDLARFAIAKAKNALPVT